MVGHTHPKLIEAITEQLKRGTLYTHPHRLLTEAATALKDWWPGMDRVRFTQSGTDSTMHALRVARAYSDREKVLKIEGSYHGVHDYVLISKSADPRHWGHPDRPRRVVESDGIPDAVAETVDVAPFNDLDAVERIFRENVNEIGALILEPIVMNYGVTEPREEYLAGLRDLCDEYGVVLIFDEVKTGVKVAPGGAAEYYGVTPDLVALAKSIGGNFPVGAFGGQAEVMNVIEEDTAHFGTYNGNPLVLRAMVTVLREILTEDAYDHAYAMGDRLATGYEEIMADAGIDGYVSQVRNQGIAMFTDERPTNYREFVRAIDPELQENYWFMMANRGVLPQPHGVDQQWTISVQHEEKHVDEHLEAFKAVARRIADEQTT